MLRCARGVGVSFKGLPHFFHHGSNEGSGFAGEPWHWDKDHLYPQCAACHVSMAWLLVIFVFVYFHTQCACHAGGGLALVALGSLVESLLSTSDSFTGGRPWEKSLKRRNSSQFGQCKALKASSIVFSNAFPHLTPIPIPISTYFP